MKATAELQVIPLGTGVSVRAEVTRIVGLLQQYDFILETHASGTDIEGELDDILAAVQKIHETLHAEGSVRLISYLKLETRTDKVPTLAGKRLSEVISITYRQTGAHFSQSTLYIPTGKGKTKHRTLITRQGCLLPVLYFDSITRTRATSGNPV